LKQQIGFPIFCLSQCRNLFSPGTLASDKPPVADGSVQSNGECHETAASDDVAGKCGAFGVSPPEYAKNGGKVEPGGKQCLTLSPAALLPMVITVMLGFIAGWHRDFDVKQAAILANPDDGMHVQVPVSSLVRLRS
jgi:hypothetical protein